MKNRHSPGCRCCGGYSTHVSCRTCNIPRVNLTWAYRFRQFSNPYTPWLFVTTLVYNPTDIYGLPVWESGPTGYQNTAPGVGTRCRIIRAACVGGVIAWWNDDYTDTGCSSCSLLMDDYEYAGDMSRRGCLSQSGLNYYQYDELTATSCTPFDMTWFWSGSISGITTTKQVRIYE